MKMSAKLYYDEYLWLKKKDIPSMEEYKRIALASANITAVNIFSLAGLGNDVITKAAFEWVLSEPAMVVAGQLISRFQDDIVTYEVQPSLFLLFQ